LNYFDTITNLDAGVKKFMGFQPNEPIKYALFDDIKFCCWVETSEAVKNLIDILQEEKTLRLYGFQGFSEGDDNVRVAYFVRKSIYGH
jgi:hypothetical protein